MLIEIAWSVLYKTLATTYLNLIADDVLERALMALQPSAAMY